MAFQPAAFLLSGGGSSTASSCNSQLADSGWQGGNNSQQSQQAQDRSGAVAAAVAAAAQQERLASALFLHHQHQQNQLREQLNSMRANQLDSDLSDDMNDDDDDNEDDAAAQSGPPSRQTAQASNPNKSNEQADDLSNSSLGDDATAADELMSFDEDCEDDARRADQLAAHENSNNADDDFEQDSAPLNLSLNKSTSGSAGGSHLSAAQQQVLRHFTGANNLSGCRVGSVAHANATRDLFNHRKRSSTTPQSVLQQQLSAGPTKQAPSGNQIEQSGRLQQQAQFHYQAHHLHHRQQLQHLAVDGQGGGQARQQHAAAPVDPLRSSSSSSSASSASSSSGCSSAGSDSFAGCSPERNSSISIPTSPISNLLSGAQQLQAAVNNLSQPSSSAAATAAAAAAAAIQQTFRSPLFLSQQQQQQHHLHHHNPNNNNTNTNSNAGAQQGRDSYHVHNYLHHNHQYELGPVHKADSDDLDKIRKFIEQFKARRGALGLTQKQAAQCFRSYTNDRYAFSDNFVGHFEGFQFRPQTAMTIADSLAEWLEFAEEETRRGRQLSFMLGKVKETRKRKYEVIRIRDSAKRVLVEAFEKNRSPSTSDLELLSKKTNIPSRNIEIFFKNRRTSRQYHQ